MLCNGLGFTTLNSIGCRKSCACTPLIPTKKEEDHPLARREYHSLRRIHVKVSSGKDERGKNRNEETFLRANKQSRASNAIRDREQERIVVIVFASVKISLFSESFTKGKRGKKRELFALVQKRPTNFSGVTKGRRGPRVLTRKNVRPNHAGFLLQRHARVRRAATGTFFLLISSSYSRVLLQNVFYLLVPHKQKNYLCRSASLREFFDRS